MHAPAISIYEPLFGTVVIYEPLLVTVVIYQPLLVVFITNEPLFVTVADAIALSLTKGMRVLESGPQLISEMVQTTTGMDCR